MTVLVDQVYWCLVLSSRLSAVAGQAYIYITLSKLIFYALLKPLA